MSRDPERKNYFSRDPRDPRDRRDFHHRDPRHQRDVRDVYRGYDKHRPMPRKSPGRSRSDTHTERRRSRSPRKSENKDNVIDENILSEIAKLPEPSELWDSQFQDNSFPPPLAPSFNHESVSNQSYPPSYSGQTSYSGVYDDFPPVISSVPVTAPQPPEWNQLTIPPTTAASSTFIPNIEDQMKKEAAIESEMRHQKAALSKQREDYMKKAGILKKELDTLKDQRNELRGDAKRSPSPDTKRFLKENTKLQLEIQNKLKTINNVVDMLNGIIGEEAQEIAAESDGSGERTSKRKSRSPSNKKSNYVYYDPEMHWCRVCNEFPPTAKDYLNHLHSPAHHKMAAAHMEAPWHTVSGINEGFPSFPSAPTKRTPIRGLQFFVPSTAWYCKLCDQFIGDLHCASAHLKSITHSKNYCNFVEQNPHWETDWMSDRQKALEKSRASSKVKVETEKPQQYAPHTYTFHKDGFHTKNSKDSPPPPPVDSKKKKEKKKKIKKRKKSSSSSSSSDSSSSESEKAKRKDKKRKKEKHIKDEKMLSEWMTSIHNSSQLTDSDRKLWDSLKVKIKQEKEDDKRSPVRSLRDSHRERSVTESQRQRQDSRAHRRSGSADKHRERERERDRERDRDRDVKKPQIRKMPFIGKMPVYKSLGKKSEDQKKDDQKKKDDDEATKKRREEMDAEIQKKVAEFKEKIAKAQQEREQAVTAAIIGPPQVALPMELGTIVPPQPPVPPAPPQPPPAPVTPVQPVPNLPKDFQEALDIIFPSDAKKDLSQDLFSGLPHIPGFLPGMTPFPPIMPNMPFMNPFDLNPPLFQPRPQLYDAHIPLVPQNHNRPNNNNHKKQRAVKQQNKNQQANKKPPDAPSQKSQIDAQAQKEKNGSVAKKKEELDDLAMLGIDASDVGAGI